MGNFLADSVTIIATPPDSSRKKVVVDSLITPVNGQKDVDPLEPGGILFVWHVTQDDPKDTVTAQLLLSKDSLTFVPIANDIRAQYVHVNDPAIDFSGTFFWRVAVETKAGLVDTSRIFKFSTLARNQVQGLRVRSIRNDTAVFVFDTVTFFAAVEDSGVTISTYEWDFDGNGTIDWQNDTNATCTHAYSDTGRYKAVFRVRTVDSKGADDTVIILVTERILEGGPLIWSIRNDTTVTVGDSIVFSALALDSAGAEITEYAWDFDGDGQFDHSDSTSASCRHAYFTIGDYKPVVRVTDANGKTAFDTVELSVEKIKLRLISFSHDTSVDYGGTVRCSLKVDTAAGELSFEIDTAHEGSFVAMHASGTSAWYSFSTAPATSWDSVTIRIYTEYSETLYTSFSVSIVPPPPPVFVTPSKDGDTIWSNATVRWTRSRYANADSVTYELLLKRGTAEFVSYESGITDTFVPLSGFDTSTFLADFKIIARDSYGVSSSAEVSGVLCKQIKKQMRSGTIVIQQLIIPGGSFVDSAGNQARITYDYFMDKTEVTQRMFDEAMDYNPSSSENNGQPVENVSWYEAIYYCNEMSKKCKLPDTAYTYSAIVYNNNWQKRVDSLRNVQCNFNAIAFRLPTEDEWEMAAHGGRNYSYATDDGTLSCAKANYGDCNNGGHPAQCGSYPANPFGIQDLTGNVWEWCWDRYTAERGAREDTTGPSTGGQRAVRGGDFNDKGEDLIHLLVTSRNKGNPANAISSLGFRCVIPMKQWR